MSKPKYFNMQHSESVVAEMASRIFSAYIQTNQVDAQNEDQLMKKATHIAIKMADYADKLIQSDEEWMKKEESRRPLGL
jgi:predicted transcriptional regulator